MSTRNLTVLAVATGLTLGIAACDTSTSTSTSAASAPPTAVATTAAAAPAAARSSPSTPRPTATTVHAAKAACPVTEAELQRAVKRSVDNGINAKSPMTKIVCYKEYAVATVPERSDSDEQYAVFNHSSGSWSLYSSGSAAICPRVPVDVVEHFRRAHYGACQR